MKKDKIKVLLKNPGVYGFQEVEIENELRKLQLMVGGNIEVLTFTTDTAIICNEEGRLNGMEFNCVFCGASFVGPILIVGVDGDEFTDCPMSAEMADGGIE